MVIDKSLFLHQLLQIIYLYFDLMKKLYSEGAYFDFAAGKYRDDDDVRLPVGYRNHGGLSGVGFKAYSNLVTL